VGSEAQDLDLILTEAENKLSSVSASKDLEDLRVQFLGKSGIVLPFHQDKLLVVLFIQ